MDLVITVSKQDRQYRWQIWRKPHPFAAQTDCDLVASGMMRSWRRALEEAGNAVEDLEKAT